MEIQMSESLSAQIEALDHLLSRVGLGDRAAFKSVYTATSGKLFAVILRILQDRATAEDVLQGVYVKVWTHAKEYQPGKASPMTWLITIARNAAIDALRRKRPQHATEDEGLVVADPGAGPEAAAILSSEMDRLRGCLGRLPQDRQEAVLGAYLDGYSYEDLAARHAVNLNTMRSWLRRALISLRECMS
jgi:RNA polymerase sigma-70 factor, ECF subfamily